MVLFDGIKFNHSFLTIFFACIYWSFAILNTIVNSVQIHGWNEKTTEKILACILFYIAAVAYLLGAIGSVMTTPQRYTFGGRASHFRCFIVIEVTLLVIKQIYLVAISLISGPGNCIIFTNNYFQLFLFKEKEFTENLSFFHGIMMPDFWPFKSESVKNIVIYMLLFGDIPVILLAAYLLFVLFVKLN